MLIKSCFVKTQEMMYKKRQEKIKTRNTKKEFKCRKKIQNQKELKKKYETHNVST